MFPWAIAVPYMSGSAIVYTIGYWHCLPSATQWLHLQRCSSIPLEGRHLGRSQQLPPTPRLRPHCRPPPQPPLVVVILFILVVLALTHRSSRPAEAGATAEGRGCGRGWGALVLGALSDPHPRSSTSRRSRHRGEAGEGRKAGGRETTKEPARMASSWQLAASQLPRPAATPSRRRGPCAPKCRSFFTFFPTFSICSYLATFSQRGHGNWPNCCTRTMQQLSMVGVGKEGSEGGQSAGPRVVAFPSTYCAPWPVGLLERGGIRRFWCICHSLISLSLSHQTPSTSHAFTTTHNTLFTRTSTLPDAPRQ